MNGDYVPPMILDEGEALARFIETEWRARRWQGIPSLAWVGGDRLVCSFYSGGRDEGPGNFVVLLESADRGAHWSEPVAAILPARACDRCFDPALWRDPLGRLWWFWGMGSTPDSPFDAEYGVWCVRFEGDGSRHTAPRRLSNGVMMNKPLALSTGEWLYPVGDHDNIDQPGAPARNPPRTPVYRSSDLGESIRKIGETAIPQRGFDEDMFVEHADCLALYARAGYGISRSISHDRGVTWSAGEDSGLGGPDSRFFIRRLRSGRLLLINHASYLNPDFEAYLERYQLLNWFTKLQIRRCNLTAMLSEDDGKTWPFRLTLDDRERVSYPDAAQGEDGTIYACYDRDRYGRGEILFARFREEDILAGRLVSPESALKREVNQRVR